MSADILRNLADTHPDPIMADILRQRADEDDAEAHEIGEAALAAIREIQNLLRSVDSSAKKAVLTEALDSIENIVGEF